MARLNLFRQSISWWVVISLVLALWAAGCTRSYDGRKGAPGDAAGKSKSDPDTMAGDPGPGSAGIEKGKQLFSSLGCMGCHTVNGKGGSVGPDLSNEGHKGRSRTWLDRQIRSPRSNDPQTVMPAYEYLSNAEVTDLVDYLLSLAASDAAGQSSLVPDEPSRGMQSSAGTSSQSITAGGKLWGQRCGQCHNLRPASQYSDAQWTVVLDHMRVRVPLTAEQQNLILEFLQASN